MEDALLPLRVGPQGCDLGLQAPDSAASHEFCLWLPQPLHPSHFDLSGIQSSKSLVSVSLGVGEGTGERDESLIALP